MYILLSLAAWTVISIIYVASRIGYKHAPQGFRKYAEYVICPPTLLVVTIASGIAYWLRKPEPPVIVTGICDVDRALDKGKRYYTQVRWVGAKGKYWCVNIYTDDEPKTEIHE